MEHGASRAKAESAAPEASVSSAWHHRLPCGPSALGSSVPRVSIAREPGAAQARGTVEGKEASDSPCRPAFTFRM